MAAQSDATARPPSRAPGGNRHGALLRLFAVMIDVATRTRVVAEPSRQTATPSDAARAASTEP